MISITLGISLSINNCFLLLMIITKKIIFFQYWNCAGIMMKNNDNVMDKQFLLDYITVNLWSKCTIVCFFISYPTLVNIEMCTCSDIYEYMSKTCTFYIVGDIHNLLQ